MSEDGSTLVSVGRDALARIWNLDTQQQLLGRIDVPFECRDVSPRSDPTKLLLLGRDHRLRELNLVSGATTDIEFGSIVPQYLAVSRNGHVLVKVGHGMIEAINLMNGSITNIPFRGTVTLNKRYRKKVDISADGRLFALIADEGTVYVGDIETGIRHELSDLGGTQIVISPRNDAVACAAYPGTVVVCDITSGERRRSSLGTVLIGGLTFSPDGKYVVVGSDDNLIRILDVESGALNPRVIHGHTGPVHSFLFADRGKTLISAAGDGQIIVWDFASGVKRFVCADLPNSVNQLAWLNDHTFLSMYNTKTDVVVLNVWQAASEEQVRAEMRLMQQTASNTE